MKIVIHEVYIPKLVACKFGNSLIENATIECNAGVENFTADITIECDDTMVIRNSFCGKQERMSIANVSSTLTLDREDYNYIEIL